MNMLEKLHVGIVGVAGRGKIFSKPFEKNQVAKIHALCDVDEDAVKKAQKVLGAQELYTDYEEMLNKSELDAVVIATPVHLHVPQSIKALNRDLHVLSEVPAGVSVKDCQDLVEAWKKSKGKYMMAENYIYMKSNVLITELVQKGFFGEVYYAEGEYLHELKDLNERTRWRRIWQTGINGITYPTHSLGPILKWMPDDRVVKVSCVGSGHHYQDPRGDSYEQEDTCVMLAKTQKGNLIKIRIDMLSNRPNAIANYSLQGTKGCYESARSRLESHKIWLEDMAPDMSTWMLLEELEDEFLPEAWKNHPQEVMEAGHGSCDYFEILDFVESITQDKKPYIDIHEAMDMTLPGIISQLSIEQEGEWLEVPNSRDW